ncbi:hypothetical protein FOA52_010174 [Chlamydomonas sp. UWO 241]|nr:hypothetical protein FOA52_010174 [Chlamydomonas sp. UWO 241]
MPLGRRSMSITTQPTPNPQTLMFMPGRTVLEGSSREFGSAGAAEGSPLAARLFKVEGVTNVFFGPEFVTVTKQADVAWAQLKPDVQAAIAEHFHSGEPVLVPSAEGDGEDHGDDEIVAMIKELLETRIRPAVNEDGGDIVFKRFNLDSGIVTLKLMGSCDGCPSSSVTLKSGIENMLMHYIPEVRGVEEDDTPEEHEEAGAKVLAEMEARLGETPSKP